jgi:hypothetical protein
MKSCIALRRGMFNLPQIEQRIQVEEGLKTTILSLPAIDVLYIHVFGIPLLLLIVIPDSINLLYRMTYDAL